MAELRRRRVIEMTVAAATVLALTGCGSASDESGTGTAGTDTAGTGTTGTAETRTVTSEVGAVEIPVDPQRIVALDEPSALNLISIGIKPDVVFDSWRTTIPRAILEAEGIEIVSTTEFYPAMEEVAALSPDLIIGTAAEGFEAAAPHYGSIAPLIGGLYYAPSEEIIRAYGDYFERPDEAESVAAALSTLTDEIASAQPEGAQSLSVLMSWAQDNMPLYMDAASSLHDSIERAGFTRPALQDEVPEAGSAFGGWTMFSPENLGEQDADVLAVAVAAQYNLEGITELPLYGSLGAVEAGRSVVVDGDLWSGGAAFYGYWVLRDLASLATGEDRPGTEADTEARWGDYLAAIAG